MENKSLLIIEKNIIKSEKTPYYNYKKLCSFTKSGLFLEERNYILKSNDLESYFHEK